MTSPYDLIDPFGTETKEARRNLLGASVVSYLIFTANLEVRGGKLGAFEVSGVQPLIVQRVSYLILIFLSFEFCLLAWIDLARARLSAVPADDSLDRAVSKPEGDELADGIQRLHRTKLIRAWRSRARVIAWTKFLAIDFLLPVAASVAALLAY